MHFIVTTFEANLQEHNNKILLQYYKLHKYLLNLISFIWRSLEKLNVDGNELTTFPAAILKLNLKKILFENTFTHPAFWKENSLNSPPSLTQITSFFFLKNNLREYYDVIPVEIQKLLKWWANSEALLIKIDF